MWKGTGPGSPDPSQEPGFNNESGSVCKTQTNKEDQKSRPRHSSRCRNKRRGPGWGPNPSLRLARAGKSHAWHQRRALRLPPRLGRQKGCGLNREVLGLCSSTDGTVNLNYSTGGRQMGISEKARSLAYGVE